MGIKKIILSSLIACVLFITLPGTSYSQTYLDSLRNNISLSKRTDIQRVDDHLKFSLELVYINPKEAFKHVEDALYLATLIDYKRGIASSYRIIGSLNSAEENYITSIDFLQRALSMFEELQDSTGIANCYISLGHTFRRQDNVFQEVFYHRKAFQIFERLNNKERLGVSMHNLGESFIKIGKLDSALILTNKAIQINTDLKRMTVLSSCYKALGKIYYAKNDYTLSETALKKAISINDDLGENSQKLALIEALIYLSDIYDIQKKYAKTIETLEYAEKVNRSYYFTEFTKTIYEKLITLYINQNNLAKARYYLVYSNKLIDSIQTKQQIDRSSLMLSAFKTYRLEEQTNLLKETNTLQSTVIKQQSYLIYLSAIFVILLTLGMVLIFRINRSLQSKNLLLAEQTALITQQKSELSTLNQTKDKFFGIVAHDIRGPIGALSQINELLIDSISKNDREQQHFLATIMKKTIENTYRLVENIISWASIQMKKEHAKPTVVSISARVKKYQDIYQPLLTDKNQTLITDVNTTHHVFADENHVDLILRNLLNNAIKFSNSNSRIWISSSIDTTESYCVIEIRDEGLGIAKEMQNKLFKIEEMSSTHGTAGEIGSGLGLNLVSEYVGMNNGKLKFVSEPGIGTTFIVELPIKKGD